MFKLSIECSKDISELHINFSDGTSAVVENHIENTSVPTKGSTVPNALKKNTPKVSRNDKPLTHIDMSESQTINQEKVKLPDIQPISRPVKVADELQNLDI